MMKCNADQINHYSDRKGIIVDDAEALLSRNIGYF